ncbi:MAG TPA: hypothetical protein PK295_04000 [Candidatus Magasanikbacteria bacterium]|nr:hypothetical protein [Candidatus Magasanikbacteria bacterium]
MSIDQIEFIDESRAKKFVEDAEAVLGQKSAQDELWNSTSPLHRFENGHGEKLEILLFPRAIGDANGSGYCVHVQRYTGASVVAELWLRHKGALVRGLELIKGYAATHWKAPAAAAT